jgi:hypothetical protein
MQKAASNSDKRLSSYYCLSGSTHAKGHRFEPTQLRSLNFVLRGTGPAHVMRQMLNNAKMTCNVIAQLRSKMVVALIYTNKNWGN